VKRVHLDDTTSFPGDGTYVLVDGALYTGEVVDTAEDGTIIALNTYVDGLEDGPQREYHYDGSPMTAYQAKRGFAVGEALQWDADGELSRRRLFSDTGHLLEDDDR
jgi:antitoxin component YwqK of YwqJK toxin-antitoxin module